MATLVTVWLSSGNFFQRRKNLWLCKFLLLCYCFRTKFQGGVKVFRGANCLRGGAPCPPVEESQQFLMSEILSLTSMFGGFSLRGRFHRPYWSSECPEFAWICFVPYCRNSVPSAVIIYFYCIFTETAESSSKKTAC